VLTVARTAELQRLLAGAGLPPLPEELVGALRARGVVAYLGDRSIGKKRLVSLPDRVTAGLGGGRPGATTAFAGSIGSMDEWWSAWTRFVFEGEALGKIVPHPEKYRAALTEVEVELSVSLQLLHLAMFDGALVQVLNDVAPGWMDVKRQLLAVDKVSLCAKILKEAYSSFDVLLLQEVTTAGRSAIAEALPDFEVVAGASHGQDSLVVVRKERFADVVNETATFAPDLPISPGDGCVVRASMDGEEVILGSFHSDSEGQSTLPFVEAFTLYAGDKKCLLGIDGNMATDPDKGKLTSTDFRAAVSQVGLHSCLTEDVWTTFKARTLVQPQFHKAVLSENLTKEADMGPKDHILAKRAVSSFMAVERDTTGNHKFLDAPLPTKSFPSDHAIVAADVFL
jgi:hypothetical protein